MNLTEAETAFHTCVIIEMCSLKTVLCITVAEYLHYLQLQMKEREYDAIT
jgi:hypothetical protein